MKHLTLFFAVTLCCCSPVSAQLVAKVNPGGLLSGTGSGSLEWFVSRHFSVQLDGYLTPGATKGDTEFSGGGAGVSARYYLSAADRPTGLFVAPFVAQHWVAFDDARSVAYNYNFTALGGQVGYQLTFKKIMTVELGCGAWTGLNVPTFRQAFGVSDYYGEGLNFWLNASLGIVLWSE